ncbi:MAG: hypothetical protein DI603_19250 [Roseateles depolymerans]|uniref:DUF4148 domain-containing protein n=1 Tax=Roseateles depolymerans TaxID=76731 RepID=A0A2W5D920_9BURK|nr:MAG: hypothetical protein DI603_19250 [Roseateles depolymerans]
MLFKQFTLAALAVIASSTALAHDNHAAGTDSVAYQPVAMHQRSRAEVIADLEIYRQSGLAALDGRDSPEVYGQAYQDAQARYQSLRSSSQFAMRVARIAQQRGEATTLAAGAMPKQPMN